MSTRKLNLILYIGTIARDWGSSFYLMGIDDDTTLRELERYDTLLYGLNNEGKFRTLFAVLEVINGVSGLSMFEKVVDEIFRNKWFVYNDIRTVYELDYYLEHDGVTPDIGMSPEDMLGYKTEPDKGKEMLEKQERFRQGGFSTYGWVSYSG